VTSPRTTRTTTSHDVAHCSRTSYALDIWCDHCGKMNIDLTLTADIRVTEPPYPPLGPPWKTAEGGIAHERAHVRQLADLSKAFLSSFETGYGSYQACVEKIPLVRASYAIAAELFGMLSQEQLH
jgi:hypothetical protein